MFDDAFNLFYMMLLFICMFKKMFLSFHLLLLSLPAHLSRRLRGELLVYQ